MKLDANPSVLFGLYSTPECKQRFIEHCKKQKLGVREISFIDVEIPLNEKYDETINSFKHFINYEYWRDRNPLFSNNFMVNQAIKAIENKTPFKVVRWNEKEWTNDKRNPLLWSLAVPLLVQDQIVHCETEEEKNNMKKLLRFESEGYVNDEGQQILDKFKEIDKEAEKLK